MGTSALKYFNDRYMGSLDGDTCAVLEQLLALAEDGGSVPDLTHLIYDLPQMDVDAIIEAYPYRYEPADMTVGTLRDYQTVAVAYMYYAKCCLLGDSVGLGKTVEVAGLCNLLSTEYKNGGKSFRYLLLTEKRTATQVRSEMIRFTGQYVHLLPSAEKKVLDYWYEEEPVGDDLSCSLVGTHALIKNGEFLAWIDNYKRIHNKVPFDILFIDESAVLAGKAKTDMVSSFKLLKKYFKRIVFMNATPIERQLQSFYNQLDLLDSSFLPTKTAFQKEYCIMRWNGSYNIPTNKYKNQDVFKRAIKYRYFASTRRSIGAEMVNCNGGVLVSDLSKAQKSLLRKSTLYRMIYDCPSYIDDTIPFDAENVPKLKDLEDLLDGVYADADSVIMFVQYKEAQRQLHEWLEERGFSNRVLNGETTYKDSERIVNGFKEKEFRVLITNVQKGLNFGSCDNCVFYGFNSNPAEMVQFEGRITRDFNIVGKNVWILCSKGAEYGALKSVVRDRAKGMIDMSDTDYSVILDILVDLMKDSKEA